VQIALEAQKWQGFILSRRSIELVEQYQWSSFPIENGWQTIFSGNTEPENWGLFARNLLCQSDNKINWAEYFDAARQTYRGARFIENKLESCIFIAKHHENLPDTSWLLQLLNNQSLSSQDRQALLSAKPPTPVKDIGRIVCSCFNVGEKTIQEAIKDQNITNIKTITACTQAGGNCGSCIPELSELLKTTA
jgi:assimilatory nitrate reductase catalytic subunit